MEPKKEKHYMLVHDGNSSRITDLHEENIPCAFVYGKFDSGELFIGTLEEAEEYRDIAAKHITDVNYIVVQVSGPDDRKDWPAVSTIVARNKELVQMLDDQNRAVSDQAEQLYHAKRESNRLSTLYGKLKAEVANTFSQHTISPQLLLSYMEALERLSILEMESEDKDV